MLAKLGQTLRELLHPLNNVAICIAFSGGLDSRFLAFAAHKLGFDVTLLHISGPHVSHEESRFAREWAASQALDFIDVQGNPLSQPQVAGNDRMRCYYCKKSTFAKLKKLAGARPLYDGSHMSDFQGYRPGRVALAELNVRSPLALAGYSKSDIRHLAASLDMDLPDQAARPCLLTRFPYGAQATVPLLSALDEAELQIQKLLQNWIQGYEDEEGNNFRVRVKEISENPISSVLALVELHIQENKILQSLAFKEYIYQIFDNLPLKLYTIRYMKKLSGYFDSLRKA